MSKSDFAHVGLGVLIAAGVTAVLSLGLSVCVLLWEIGDTLLTVCNQLIKVCSVFAAVSALRRQWRGRDAVFGTAIGTGYVLTGMGVYCAFAGRLLPVFTLCMELVLGTVSGALSGIAASHMGEKPGKIRKRRRK